MSPDPLPIVEVQTPYFGMMLGTTNDALWDDIGFTPALEDGIGPVAIGTRIQRIDLTGKTWYIVCHPFSEIDGEWLTAYTSGDNPPVTILDPVIVSGWTSPPIQ